MAIPSLPLDLIARIISYIEPDLLAPYACINRQWQGLVEKRIFCALNLKTARLANFQRIVTPHRCSYARRLELNTNEDRRCNNETFTDTICTLLTIMSAWPDESNIELSILNTSPSDFTEDPNPSNRRMLGMKMQGMNILHWRYMTSYLELQKPIEEIPTVRAISNLVVYWGIERSISQRQSLTQWPESPEHLVLEYTGETPKHADYPPNKRSKPGADAFSIAFRQMSTHLKTIHLEGVMVGLKLFWLQNNDDTEEPSWPNLTSFHLTYAAATPSGEWLFGRDPRCPEYDVQAGLNGLWRHGVLQCEINHEFHYDHVQGRVGWVGSWLFPLDNRTREAWV
ncbi:hypothetical protein BJX76DRAFT_345409 [Aspergillus varians]